MSLMHVCVWNDKNGYCRVAIEEACQMYPYAVAADSGIFVCSLCAQKVSLTGTGKNARHFRHTSREQNKECRDRARVYDQVKISYESHPMPMRIKVINNEYRLELGFFYPCFSSKDGPTCQKIKIMGEHGQKFSYLFERISSDGVTYLNVGNIPSSSYHLTYDSPSPSLNRYWPSTTPGIASQGAFFECHSGRRLYSGGKLYSQKSYFLLQKDRLSGIPKELFCEKIAETKVDFSETWYLYKIYVSEFSASIARFFLKWSIFLTDKAVEFYPVWPPYVEDTYFRYHDNSIMYFYMLGRDVVLSGILFTHKPYHIPANKKEAQHKLF